MKLEYNRESADALYTLADALPASLRDLTSDTQRLLSVYQSVQDSVGPHAETFIEMARCIGEAIRDTGEVSEELSKLFRKCADMIMEFIEDVPPELKLTLKRR